MTVKEQIEKAYAKKQKKTFAKWWNENGYKIMRVILWPIWLYEILREKKEKRDQERLNAAGFSKEVCKKYLDKALPDLIAKSHDASDEILITDADDMGGVYFNQLYRCKNKKISNFFSRFMIDVKNYIIEEYTIDNYNKITLSNWTDWARAKDMFDWYDTPYHSDYRKGVVFYTDDQITGEQYLAYLKKKENGDIAPDERYVSGHNYLI